MADANLPALNGQDGDTTNSAWVKIDLAQLNQTGLTSTPNLYMLGYASASGQMLQYIQDPIKGQIIAFGPPMPSDLTLPSSQFTIDGSNVTLETNVNLFVGGQVTFLGGTSTIKSITANVVCANQTGPSGPFQAFTNPTWQQGANAVVLNPSAINQGSVANGSTGANITALPITAGTASGIGLGSLVNGYFPAQGKIPTAQAVISAGTVTGVTNLEANGGTYQYPPTVTFPGQGVETVATGNCTLDANGYVTGVTMTNAGSGYTSGGTYYAIFSPPPGLIYFFPSDQNGFPGTNLASDAATATSISADGANMTVQLSKPTDQPSWEQPSPIALGGSTAINVYSGGMNTLGYATLQSFTNPPPDDLTTPNTIIADLPSTLAVQGYNTNSAGSSIVVEGAAGSVMIYTVVNYTITLADSIPADTTSLTFSCSVVGTVNASGTGFTLSPTTYPGIAAALSIGQSPTISNGSTSIANLSITSLSLSDESITVELSGPLPASFQNQQVTVQLPPTGGTLPVFQWDSTTNNALWAQQLPGVAGAISVNGARIYFILDIFDYGPPSFNFSVGLNANQNQVIAVTQPPDALVWEGKVSPFQYIELTLDALPQAGGGGDGMVYIDLSAVDGFFFPAALSTTINTQNLLMGQPWQAYQTSNQAYNAVMRTDILTAWQTFFGNTANFASDPNAQALAQAYINLVQSASGQVIGIQNPTFAYMSPDTSITAFDNCWNDTLDALFTTQNEIDLTGDLLINGQTAYYKGSQVTGTDSQGQPFNAIRFDEYQGNYSTPTGASFWVFDPRTPPITEGQAYVSATNPMSVGYQVFANTGVFASVTITQGGNSPNYQPPQSAGWSANDALKQLTALQRDIVTAINRGVGALGIGTISGNSPAAGVTSTYWNTETNWYPFCTPYQALTPQNLYSQWVHTAIIDQANNKYYATYPFGASSGYGDPQKTANGGLLMNQTYGFGYDETPNNGANVPSKFLPIVNTAGNVVEFQLVFGPWGTT